MGGEKADLRKKPQTPLPKPPKTQQTPKLQGVDGEELSSVRPCLLILESACADLGSSACFPGARDSSLSWDVVLFILIS